ncbi:MAG: Mrp/NBP35 family ATP-binding protein [Candidatus Dormibacteraceae bacterium]
MSPHTTEAVLAALAQIIDPDLGRDVVSLGMIKELNISPQGEVAFKFELTTPACPVRDRFKTQAIDAVQALPGTTRVEVEMTAQVRSGIPRPKAVVQLPEVKQVIAVASGKGGVGKSTVAVNLATALATSGAAVGLLDADIYGPSIPGMTGTHGQPVVREKRLIPPIAHGVKLMSLGLLADAEKAMVWRGPMVSKAIQQMAGDVQWGALDYLIIDLPPGTGDASLTVAQALPLAGVVIVATPQDIALGIAVKALKMFRTLKTPIVGLVENMSWFICPTCNDQHHIFGEGQVEQEAERLGVAYLGAVPLDPRIGQAADQGLPIVISHPESVGATAFGKIAGQVAANLSIHSHRQLPVLNAV